ncbi:MAG TPA: hypothetical protein VMU08_18790 [Rhizomicrobium sp.]|nr:hypothetical protein [Rhizomicrobium sp.]
MNERTGWPTIVAAAIIVTGFATALAASWPGQLSYDSILQLLQGRTGIYNTWHPPVMAWLLGLGDTILPGTGLFLLFDALLAFGALLSLLFLPSQRTRWAAPVVALVVALSPQLLIYQGLIWKDVLFADTSVAGFVCLAHAAERWHEVSARAVLLTAGFLLLAIAALARQNGAVVLPFAAAGLGWIAARNGAAPVPSALLAAGLLGAGLAFVFTANVLLNLRSDGEPGTQEQLRLLQLYDLSGAVARQPGLELARLANADPDFESVIRTRGAALYTPVRNDPLASAADVQRALVHADDAAIAAQWRDLILQHPWLYLRNRAAVFGWVFLTPDIAACRPIFTGIEGPARELAQLGIAPRRDARDLAMERYGKAFMGTPVLSHASYAIVGLACLILLLRRRRPADIAFAALLGAAFAFTASFFVISISCDYRYLYALDLSAIAALLYLARDPRSAFQGNP